MVNGLRREDGLTATAGYSVLALFFGAGLVLAIWGSAAVKHAPSGAGGMLVKTDLLYAPQGMAPNGWCGDWIIR